MTMRFRFFNVVLCANAVYMLIMSVWPLVHIEGFMRVTGYKTDIWLVKTGAVLMLAIALTLLLNLKMRVNELPSILLGVLTSGALAIIDFYYVKDNVIDEIYAFDGAAQGLFFCGWILAFVRWSRDYF